MWAEGRESSDLQLRPSLSGSGSRHRATLWFGIATLSFVHRALWDLWVKVPLLCHFKNTVKALQMNVLGSATGNRSCPLPARQSQCFSLDRLSGWQQDLELTLKEEHFSRSPHRRSMWTWKEKALLMGQRVSAVVFKTLCWTEAPRAFPNEAAWQPLRGTGVQALLSSPEL